MCSVPFKRTPVLPLPARGLVSLLSIGLCGALLACGGGQRGPKAQPLFYPPLPNKPRMQFLRAFNAAGDVESTSRIAEFLVGKAQSASALGKPNAAVVVGDRVIVADPGLRRVVVFDLANETLRGLRGAKEGGRPQLPMQITASADGSVFVTDMKRKQILAYGPDETFLRAYGRTGELQRPAGVAVSRGLIYVCDREAHEIKVFNRQTGKLVRRLGGAGQALGKLYIPTYIAVGPSGDLYVTEMGNFRVQRMRPDGTGVRSFGKLGDSLGDMTRPRGVAVDPAGRVYVVDAAFEYVQVFSPKGRLLMFLGGPGNNRGNLVLPAGIQITRDGVKRFQTMADPRLALRFLVVVVSQYGRRRVSVFGFGDWKGPVPKRKAPAPKKKGAGSPGKTSAPGDGPASAE